MENKQDDNAAIKCYKYSSEDKKKEEIQWERVSLFGTMESSGHNQSNRKSDKASISGNFQQRVLSSIPLSTVALSFGHLHRFIERAKQSHCPAWPRDNGQRNYKRPYQVLHIFILKPSIFLHTTARPTSRKAKPQPYQRFYSRIIPTMDRYDQAYGDMMRKLPESYQSRYGQICTGKFLYLACGHTTPVVINRYPGCYKCAEARPALCQPSYPDGHTDNRRCAPCQAEADRQAHKRH